MFRPLRPAAYLRNACENLAALSLVVGAGFAVAVVGIRTTVERVVRRASPQRVVPGVAVEPVVAALDPDVRGCPFGLDEHRQNHEAILRRMIAVDRAPIFSE